MKILASEALSKCIDLQPILRRKRAIGVTSPDFVWRQRHAQRLHVSCDYPVDKPRSQPTGKIGNKTPRNSSRENEHEDHMSSGDAEATLRAVTGWARCAELFAYDDHAKRFTLDNPA